MDRILEGIDVPGTPESFRLKLRRRHPQTDEYGRVPVAPNTRGQVGWTSENLPRDFDAKRDKILAGLEPSKIARKSTVPKSPAGVTFLYPADLREIEAWACDSGYGRMDDTYTGRSWNAKPKHTGNYTFRSSHKRAELVQMYRYYEATGNLPEYRPHEADQWDWPAAKRRGLTAEQVAHITIEGGEQMPLAA